MARSATSFLKTKAQKSPVAFSLSQALVDDLKTLEADLGKVQLEFDKSAIVEEALIKAVKAARKELSARRPVEY